MLGPAPSPEQPWHSNTAMPLSVGPQLPACRGNGIPALSWSHSLAPTLLSPGGAPHSPVCSGWTMDNS